MPFHASAGSFPALSNAGTLNFAGSTDFNELHEMGIDTPLQKIFDFIYRTEFDNGLTEFEFDHVYSGVFDGMPRPDSREVKEFCFRSPDMIEEDLRRHPEKYSSWFRIAFPKVIAKRNLF